MPKRVEELRQSENLYSGSALRETLSRFSEGLQTTSLLVVHSRPMLRPTGDAFEKFGLPQLQADLSITSVGDEPYARTVLTEDQPGARCPDLPFSDTSRAQVENWMHEVKASGKKGLIVAPYIRFAPDSWGSVLREIDTREDLALIAVNPKELTEIEGKQNFENILRASGITPPLKTTEYASLDAFQSQGGWERAREMYGDKFVVQIGESAGGSGTRLVGVAHTTEDAERMIATGDGWFKVVEYAPGYETNGQAIVLPDGRVLLDPLSHKPSSNVEREIRGGKKGGANGDDWSVPFPETVQAQYQHLMTSVGRYLKEHYNYTGIFGIDSIVTPDGRLLPHEINARPQGTSMHHDRRAVALGRPSTLLIHIMALSGMEQDFSFLPTEDEWNRQVRGEAGGWQFDLAPLESEEGMVVTGDATGNYSWNEESQTLQPDPNGDIWIVGPQAKQIWTLGKNRDNTTRLTAPGQVFYVPSGRNALPAIFDPNHEALTDFGRTIIPRARELVRLRKQGRGSETRRP